MRHKSPLPTKKTCLHEIITRQVHTLSALIINNASRAYRILLL